jgi:hypothetical protein
MKRLGKNKSWAINETNIFAAILDQRALVERAQKETMTARRARVKASSLKASAKVKEPPQISDSGSDDLLQTIKPYDVEVWE